MTVKLRIRPGRAGKTALVYLLVLLVSFIFAFPCVWLVLSAFNAEGDLLTLDGFFPKEYSFDTFRRLFTEANKYDYPRWFGNTLFVAAVSCVISTFLVIAVAYTISRYRFKSRKAMMKATLILGIFPNFMNMTALFVIMTQLHLINNLWGADPAVQQRFRDGLSGAEGVLRHHSGDDLRRCHAGRCKRFSGICVDHASSLQTNDRLHGAHVVCVAVGGFHAAEHASH